MGVPIESVRKGVDVLVERKCGIDTLGDIISRRHAVAKTPACRGAGVGIRGCASGRRGAGYRCTGREEVWHGPSKRYNKRESHGDKTACLWRSMCVGGSVEGVAWALLEMQQAGRARRQKCLPMRMWV